MTAITLDTARYVFDSLHDLPATQLETLASDLERDGGAFRTSLGAAVRSLTSSSSTLGRPNLVRAMWVQRTTPDPGEVDRLVAELSDQEPWATLRTDLERK